MVTFLSLPIFGRLGNIISPMPPAIPSRTLYMLGYPQPYPQEDMIQYRLADRKRRLNHVIHAKCRSPTRKRDHYGGVSGQFWDLRAVRLTKRGIAIVRFTENHDSDGRSFAPFGNSERQEA